MRDERQHYSIIHFLLCWSEESITNRRQAQRYQPQTEGGLYYIMGKGGQLDKGEILSETAKAATSETIPTQNANNESTSTTTDAAATGGVDKSKAPWYSRGGMHVNEAGMGINVTVPPIFLAATAAATALHDTYTPVHIFAALFLLQVIMARTVHGMQTVFCCIAVPCYLTSLLVIPGTLESRIIPTIVLAVAIAMWRVGVCMSVCLHRYAAHAAFKCNAVTQLFLNLLGCAAHQGGPIWWASQHRCHHKYCDLPRDPHSPIQDGVENAFAFFGNGHAAVEEEFAPKHNDNWYLRILDTWSFSVATLEMLLAYHFLGREGLFVSYSSIWICQTITLWFNIANHPPDGPGEICKAANHKMDPEGWYPAFLILDVLYPYFGVVVSEGDHEDHHKYFMLAKRDSTDCAYYSFIWPMEKLGLVWDVKVAPPE